MFLSFTAHLDLTGTRYSGKPQLPKLMSSGLKTPVATPLTALATVAHPNTICQMRISGIKETPIPTREREPLQGMWAATHLLSTSDKFKQHQT